MRCGEEGDFGFRGVFRVYVVVVVFSHVTQVGFESFQETVVFVPFAYALKPGFFLFPTDPLGDASERKKNWYSLCKVVLFLLLFCALCVSLPSFPYLLKVLVGLPSSFSKIFLFSGDDDEVTLSEESFFSPFFSPLAREGGTCRRSLL